MLVYWAGLQKQEVATQMEHGAAILKSVALQFHQQVQQKEDDSQAIIKTWRLQFFAAWKSVFAGLRAVAASSGLY